MAETKLNDNQLAQAGLDGESAAAVLTELQTKYAQGKIALAKVLTQKGEETSASEDIIAMADKVNALPVATPSELLTAYAPSELTLIETLTAADAIRVFPYEGYNNVILKNDVLYMIPEGNYQSLQEMLDSAVSTMPLTYTTPSQANATYTCDGKKILVLTKDSDSAFHVEIYNVDWENQNLTFHAIATPNYNTSTKLTEKSFYMCDPDGKFLLWSASLSTYSCYMWNIQNETSVNTYNLGNYNVFDVWMTPDKIVLNMHSYVYTNDGLGNDWSSGSTRTDFRVVNYDSNTGEIQTASSVQITIPYYNLSMCRILDKGILVLLGAKYVEKPQATGMQIYPQLYPRRLGAVALDLNTGIYAPIPVNGYEINLHSMSGSSTSYYRRFPFYVRHRKISEKSYNILVPGLPENAIIYNADDNSFVYSTDEVNSILHWQINDRDSAFAAPLAKKDEQTFLHYSVDLGKINNALLPNCGGNCSLEIYRQDYRKSATLFGMSKMLGSGDKKTMPFPNITQKTAYDGTYDLEIIVTPETGEGQQ